MYYFQAMQSFSAALASGQLGPLMNQFGLGDEVAAAAAAGGKYMFFLYLTNLEIENYVMYEGFSFVGKMEELKWI